MRRLFLSAALVGAAVAAQAQPATLPPPVAAPTVAPVALPQTNFYEVATPKGRFVVRLFDETPLHRDNFKRLVATAFYDSTAFHRIIEGFVVQGGDPNTRDADPMNDGNGDPGYTVPAEIGRPHLRGALSAARQPDEINPARESSGSQFYVVTGRLANDAWLDEARRRVRATSGDTTFDWSPEIRERYKAQGGVPFLDGQYSVFGEVVEGLDVVMALETADTPRRQGLPPTEWIDRPFERLWIVVRPLSGYTPPPALPAPPAPGGQ